MHCPVRLALLPSAADTLVCPQLRARCEELRLDWSTLSLENLRKEKQALRSQISEKQRHCLELQVGFGAMHQTPPSHSEKGVCDDGQQGCVCVCPWATFTCPCWV